MVSIRRIIQNLSLDSLVNFSRRWLFSLAFSLSQSLRRSWWLRHSRLHKLWCRFGSSSWSLQRHLHFPSRRLGYTYDSCSSSIFVELPDCLFSICFWSHLYLESSCSCCFSTNEKQWWWELEFELQQQFELKLQQRFSLEWGLSIWLRRPLFLCVFSFSRWSYSLIIIRLRFVSFCLCFLVLLPITDLPTCIIFTDNNQSTYLCGLCSLWGCEVPWLSRTNKQRNGSTFKLLFLIEV